MATSGVDAKLKLWDLRNYKCLHEYRTSSNGASTLTFSQKKLLAASYRDVVEVIILIDPRPKPILLISIDIQRYL
jgi:U3 small nucleolar RNA-associated protein 7